MHRILFVCLGNICRSPMAEMILKDMVRQRGLDGEFEIASCATSTEEIGNPVYPPARAELARRGVKCEHRAARQLTKADYEKYDLLIGMDENNIRNMKRMLGGDPKGKIRKMMEFAGSFADVADPWYTGGFDVTYRDIQKACEGLLKELQ